MGSRDEVICVCMDVNKSAIVDAIKKHKLLSIDEVGEITEAGISCGACQGEIEEILTEVNG